MIIRIILAAACLSASPALALDFLAPKVNAAACSKIPALPFISEKSLSFGPDDFTCTLGNATDVRDLDATLYDATCGKGGKYEPVRRIMIARYGSGQGSQIVILDRETVRSYVSCGDGSDQP